MDIDSTLQARVSETITFWHQGLPRELLRSETLVWLSVAPNVRAPGDVQDALDFAARLEGSAMASGDDPQWADVVKRFGHALLSGMPEAIYERIPALQTVRVAVFQGVPAPKSIDPAAIRSKLERPGETRHWYVRQVGARWVFGLNERGTEWPSYIQGPGSPLAWFEASRPWVTVVRGQTVEEFRLEPGLTLSFDLDEPVELRTDRCTVRMVPWVRESWTIAAGRDRYGLWADADIRGVVQRFRWIPPGRFLMGSPESEEGRFDNEGPQHWVTLLEGRWFGDTPVTQALWSAVTGHAPSYFQGDARSTHQHPVDSVSWNECQDFARAVEMRLPSEAEWEYACRGGTRTSTWKGDHTLRSEIHWENLDAIAWYSRNCSVGFERNNVYRKFAGLCTRTVRMKEANPFGLYDVLGNIDEWCQDAEHSYEKLGIRTDPPPIEEEGAYRIRRGGSWNCGSEHIRAAVRFTYPADLRHNDFGLRLAMDPIPRDAQNASAMQPVWAVEEALGSNHPSVEDGAMSRRPEPTQGEHSPKQGRIRRWLSWLFGGDEKNDAKTNKERIKTPPKK